jgi:hypothetical protein
MNITSSPLFPANSPDEMIRPDTTSGRENWGTVVPSASMFEAVRAIPKNSFQILDAAADWKHRNVQL